MGAQFSVDIVRQYMSISRTLAIILVLATSISVFAQTTETKPPDVGSSGAKALDQGRKSRPTQWGWILDRI